MNQSIEQRTLSAHQPPLEQVAAYLQNFAPDLSQMVCICPNDFLAAELKRALCQKNALMLPQMLTLRRYLNQRVVLEKPVLSPQLATLHLSQMLHAHRHLYGKGSAWQLAEELLALFEELDAHAALKEQSFEAFLANIAADAPQFVWLDRQARLVHSLWQLWRQELTALDILDASSAYRQQLAADQNPPAATRLLFLCDAPLGEAEQTWLARYSQHIPVTVFDFAPIALDESARQGYQFTADSFEELAQGVATLAQDCAQQGARTMIIGSERKLTRRLQAIFAAKHIQVDDKSGWALSTTSVGALVENWLLCIEQDFYHHVFANVVHANSANWVSDEVDSRQLWYRFFADLKNANINATICAGLGNYQNMVQQAAKKFRRASGLPADAIAPIYEGQLALLAQIQNAAAPLLALFQGEGAPLGAYIDAVLESLKLLNALDFIAQDSAGALLVGALLEQQSIAQNQPMFANVRWQAFRQWLYSLLEGSYFRPAASGANISILTWQQAAYLTADVAILCDCDANHLPAAERGGFFNQASRQQLGLETKTAKQARLGQNFARQIARHRQLICAWQKSDANGEIAASNWLLRLQIGGLKLWDLGWLRREWAARQAELSTPQHAYTPLVDVDCAPLLPKVMSVSAHQRLIQNPFDFYVRDVLGLTASDEIREVLQSSDYGSLVHRILQALYQDCPPLPAAYHGAWLPAHQQEINNKIKEIAKSVFAVHLAQNYEHQAWYARFLASVARLLAWQFEVFPKWQFYKAEVPTEIPISPNLTLRGRIDRMDQISGEDIGSALVLIDYKTGSVPSKSAMLAGEDVQLTSYALAHPAAAVLYLGVKPQGQQSQLQGEDLTAIAAASKARLAAIFERLLAGERWLAHVEGMAPAHRGLSRADAWAAYNISQ